MARIIFESNKCNNIELEERDITIDDNGTYAITPNEGYAGMSKVDVNVGVDTLQGLNFEGVYDAEQGDEINQYYKDGIEYAKKIVREWNENITSVNQKFRNNLNIVFFPKINMENVIDAWGAFYDAKHLEYLSNKLDFSNVKVMTYTFFRCNRLKTIDLDLSSAIACLDMCNLCASLEYAKLYTPLTESLENIFAGCSSLFEVHLTDVSKCGNFSNTFSNCNNLKIVKIERWKQGDINLRPTYIIPESINHIIEHSLGANEGAVERVLYMYNSEFDAWQNSPNYEYYQAMAIEKLISIATI